MKDPAPIKGVNRILILRADGIGDVLNSTPAISALRNAYRAARISVVVRPPGAEILRLNSHIDEVQIYDVNGAHKDLMGKLRFAKQLRMENYDLAVVLYNSSQSNLMAYLSRAPYRVGRKSERKGFSFTLTSAVAFRDPKGTKHEIDRNMDVVRLAGAKAGTRELVLSLSDREKAWACDYIRRSEVRSSQPLVGIHPGGTSFDKLWPAENFARVANSLMQEFGAQIILFSGPGEDALARDIEAAMAHAPIPAAGLQLRQFAALTEKCSLFLCNDSGPMHIAAALQVPTVAIFGSTDHVRWRPYSDNSIIVRRDMDCWPCSAHKCKREFECTKLLPVSDVWSAVCSMLNIDGKLTNSVVD